MVEIMLEEETKIQYRKNTILTFLNFTLFGEQLFLQQEKYY